MPEDWEQPRDVLRVRQRVSGKASHARGSRSKQRRGEGPCASLRRGGLCGASAALKSARTDHQRRQNEYHRETPEVPPRPARAPPLSLRPRYPRPRSGRARTTFPISDVADCVRTDGANDSPGEGRFRESLVGGAGTSSVGFSSFGPAPGRRERAAAAGRGVQEAPRARGQRSGRGARVGEVPPRPVPAVTEPR